MSNRLQKSATLRVCRRRLAALLLIATAFSWSRMATAGESAEATPVAAVKASRRDLSRSVTVQGEFRPFQEIDLHSKVAGFLKTLDVDLGDRVEAGEAIGELEAPELAADLQKAMANARRSEQEIRRTEINHHQEQLAYQRLLAVNKDQPNLVAQSDIDLASSKEQAAASSLAAAKEQLEASHSEIEKLKTMLNYCKITAPFAGVITKRYVDPGALIQTGTSSSTQARPLVRLSELHALRLAFPVSVSYVPNIRKGNPISVDVPTLKTNFVVKICRVSHSIDTATRTMMVEADVPNEDLRIVPGMYASVAVTLEERTSVVTLPVQAVARGAEPTVLVVTTENHLEERKVKLGLETSDYVEIASGIKEGETVVIGSRAQFSEGQQVEPKYITAAVE